MPGYVEFPLNDDPAALIGRILDGMRLAMPGWVPTEGTPEVVLAEEIGRELADLLTLVVNVSAATVTKFGTTVFQVPQLTGTRATMTATVTLANPGATIPAGFVFIGRNADGADTAMVTSVDVTAPAATSTISVGLQAQAVGAYANGIPTGPLTLANASDVVVSAVATSVSTNGVDPETDTAYQDRLVTSLATLTRTPILPSDYATRARDVTGVTRALAIDGYDPASGLSNVEKTITLVPVDGSGLPVSTTIAANLRDLMTSLREVNFQVFTTTPTYTPVSLVFSAVAKAGANPETVRAAMLQRGLDLLSPATWGGGDESPPTWVLSPTVRRNLVLAQLASVDGCAYITSLTINGATTDLALAGKAPLPAPSNAADAVTAGVAATTVTGTVVSA